MATSAIETLVGFDDRLELSRRIVFDSNFDSRTYPELATWISEKSGQSISEHQIGLYAQKLKQAILKPQRCTNPGLVVICRRLGVI